MGMHKPFSNDLYLEHDAEAKIKAIEFYKTLGISLSVNPNMYGVDLIGDDVNVEVEHKVCWTDDIISPVYIFARKYKMKTGKTEFFIFNKDYTKAMIIKEKSLIYPDRLILQKNKYMDEEAAYEIPLNEIEYVNLEK